MKVYKKTIELIDLLNAYIKNEANYQTLHEFSWDVIEKYVEKDSDKAPLSNQEKIFWHSIWQLQHLADKEHENDGTLKREAIELLGYLSGRKQIPAELVGKRPVQAS